MPIIKSAIKRARQTAKRRSHNLKVKALVKQDVHVVTTAVTAGDLKAATAALSAAQSEIDRAVKKGTLHKNTAARRKSRLSALIKKNLVTAKPAKGEKPKAATAPGKKTPAKKPTSKTTKK